MSTLAATIATCEVMTAAAIAIVVLGVLATLIFEKGGDNGVEVP